MKINAINSVQQNKSNNKSNAQAFQANLNFTKESKQIVREQLMDFYIKSLANPKDLENYFEGNRNLVPKDFLENMFASISKQFEKATKFKLGNATLIPGNEGPFANEYLQLSYQHRGKTLDSQQITDPIVSLLPNKKLDNGVPFSHAASELAENLRNTIFRDNIMNHRKVKFEKNMINDSSTHR